MTAEQEEEIVSEMFAAGFDPVSTLPGHEWVAKHVQLGSSSELPNVDYELVPITKFFFEQVCHNPSLRHYTEMISAQCGKTTRVSCYVAWKVKNKPSDIGFYTDSNGNAKTFYKTKMADILENCDQVSPLLPKDRNKKTATLIQFASMNLHILGAESKRNREGKPFPEVIKDESRRYPPGASEQIDNRYKTFSNFRCIEVSTAPESTSLPPWTTFKRGTQHMLFWPCPKCGHKQTFRFGRDRSPLYPTPRKCGGFVWDDNETTHPEELVYNFDALTPTIRYECENENCRHNFIENEKYGLIKTSDPVATNPMAEQGRVSVHCWEAYMPWEGCKWAAIVKKFLNAVVLMKQGSISAMKIFICETLGEPWEEQGEKPLEGEILKRCGEYSMGEEWPAEIKCARQITADNQHGYLHFNYSAFNQAGEKRTIQRGKLLTFDDLREFQKAKKVQDRGVGIDCAHKPRDVYEQCLKYGSWRADPTGGKNHIWNGWIPLLGDEAEDFTRQVKDANGAQQPVKTYWREVLLDTNIGRAGQQKHIHRFSWSGPHYKTELYLYRIKGKGLLWEIYKNIEAEYVEQMQATELFELRDAEGKVIKKEFKERGRHDDGDCEAMQLALADINGIGKIK